MKILIEIKQGDDGRINIQGGIHLESVADALTTQEEVDCADRLMEALRKSTEELALEHGNGSIVQNHKPSDFFRPTA